MIFIEMSLKLSYFREKKFFFESWGLFPQTPKTDPIADPLQTEAD